MKKAAFIAFVLLALSSCERSSNAGGGDSNATVGKAMLTRTELKKALPGPRMRMHIYGAGLKRAW